MPKIWYRLKGRLIGKLFDLDRRCQCGSGMRPHFTDGDPSCEYWRHHCEMCHGFKSCTIRACRREFKSTGAE